MAGWLSLASVCAEFCRLDTGEYMSIRLTAFGSSSLRSIVAVFASCEQRQLCQIIVGVTNFEVAIAGFVERCRARTNDGAVQVVDVRTTSHRQV